MDPRETEDIVHRALKRLRPPVAPRTLLPRVMAAVAEQTRERAQTSVPAGRTAFRWSLAWQAPSIAALFVAMVAVIWGWPSIEDVTGGSHVIWSSVKLQVVTLAQSAAALTRVVSIVWEAFLQPIVGFLLAWIVLMSGACATFAAALGRVALGGASQS
jgi:hypothetical protein